MSRPDFHIRSAKNSDADMLSVLHEPLFNRGWSSGEFMQFIQSHSDIVLVACDTSKYTIFGFIVIRVIVDEAEILTVGVRTDTQRSGVGQMLCEMAFEAARRKGASSVFLDVRCDNKKAINLYTKLGFQLVGRRYGYYKNNDNSERMDGLVMKVSI